MSGAATRLAVWVQPRAARTEVAGHYGNAIKIRIAAPPVDGAANEELVRFLAKALSVPRGAVRLKSGAAGRRKILEVEGLELGEVEKRLGVSRLKPRLG